MIKSKDPKQEKINQISVDLESTLLQAMQKMNEHYLKLLLVLDNDQYVGLISIGDIQRDFLKHHDFNRSLSDAMRKSFRVASETMEIQEIKEMMLQHRTEFMPVLDHENNLQRVIFWEDVFGEKKKSNRRKIDVPIVIMAGGKGTRLKPITNIIPKPLIPIGDRAIMEVIMDRFVDMGSNEFFISVNYKADMIKHYFDELKHKNYKINYFIEDKPLGTAGSLHLVKDKIKKPFFVSNCDIIIDQDYSEIYDYHVENGNDLTLVAAVKQFKIPYGILELNDEGLLKEIKEKPESSVLVNAGFYLLEPHVIDKVPENEFYHITHLMEDIIKKGGKVGVFPVNESSWMDIGEWKYYRETLKRYNVDVEFNL